MLVESAVNLYQFRGSETSAAVFLTLPIPSDSFLLSEVQRGDVAAMGCLYDAHSEIVFSVACRVLRDPVAAEDVVQEVFLKIWRHPSSFVAARGSLHAWLAITSRNRAIDVLRRRRSMDSLDDHHLQASDNISDGVERSLMVNKAKALILRLPPNQKIALEMAFFDGFTHAEIAEKLQIPLGTIKTRIRTAIQTLGTALRSQSHKYP